MNWNTLSAWIYKDSTPDYAKLAAYGIGVVYIDPRSANAATVVSDLRTRSFMPGVYTAPDWQPSMDAPTFAKWTSDQLNAVVPRGSLPEAPPYMGDFEGVDPTWQASFLASYRSYQPHRPSSVTVAPFQGGLIDTHDLAGWSFHLYPQLYYGDMSPADPAAVLLEMARQGFPAAMLHPFYDGARLPADRRDGCVFTAERLP